MTCISPIVMRNQLGHSVSSFSCRKCIPCRVVRSSQWKLRTWHEFVTLGCKGMFITLTYSDDSLPQGGTLVKKHFQDFIKRVRFYFKNVEIKYLASGEYGGNTFRAHYHCVILGISNSLDNQEIVRKAWKLGFLNFGAVTPESISYVCKYITKRLITSDENIKKAVYGDKLPEFQLQSTGMGLRYIKHYYVNNEDSKEDYSFSFRGNRVPMFRYYRNKLSIDTKAFCEFLESKGMFKTIEESKQDAYRIRLKEQMRDPKMNAQEVYRQTVLDLVNKYGVKGEYYAKN